MNRPFTINKFLPVALLYFFFNGFLLPQGLLYTSLLAPFFLYWNLNKGTLKNLLIFLVVAIPFVLAHLINGVVFEYYIRSFILFFSIYIFLLALRHFLYQCHTLRTIYRVLILVNIVFALIAVIILLTHSSLAGKLWYTNAITNGVVTTRLQLLTYEPSYYSTLMVPIAAYYYLKMITLKLPNPATTAVLISVPLLLSLSFGVIIGLAMALALTLLYGWKHFFLNKNLPIYIIAGTFVLCLVIAIAFLFFPHNVFVVRLTNVFGGSDTSFKGRTSDSFYLAWKIAEQKSVWFGCGFGQTKVLALDLFKEFYHYEGFTVDSVGIPNAVGDTLATLGILGIVIRFSLQVYFFFKTRVYSNYYRLMLFLFIFIYQFQGSFITNTAEYVIWVMAFTPGIFEEFDRKNFYGH
jgi:hypothetical protein